MTAPSEKAQWLVGAALNAHHRSEAWHRRYAGDNLEAERAHSILLDYIARLEAVADAARHAVEHHDVGECGLVEALLALSPGGGATP